MQKRTSMRPKESGRKKSVDRSAVSLVMSEMGRKGGLKGGRARAAKLSPEQRTEIPRRAAMTRWSTPSPGQSQFNEQKRRFQSIPADVLAAYKSRFVAARNGKIIDSDDSLSRLTQRVFAESDKPVYITRAGNQPVTIAPPLLRR